MHVALSAGERLKPSLHEQWYEPGVLVHSWEHSDLEFRRQTKLISDPLPVLGQLAPLFEQRRLCSAKQCCQLGYMAGTFFLGLH